MEDNEPKKSVELLKELSMAFFDLQNAKVNYLPHLCGGLVKASPYAAYDCVDILFEKGCVNSHF